MKIQDRPVFHLQIEDSSFKYTLVNKAKDFIKHGNSYMFVEWSDEGVFKERHNLPAVGLSLLFDWTNFSYGWLTTTITEILEQTDKLIRFKTENSEYELIIHEQQLQED